MIIWSIHNLDFFKKLERNKIIYPNKKKLTFKEFFDSYDWIANQMDKRIGGRPHFTALPFWGWYQYKDANHKRPDLRLGGHLESGAKGVRLELDIPDDKVLLSDFDMWGAVLNKSYIPKSPDDYDDFYRSLDAENLYKFSLWSKSKQKQAEKSWKKIFDLQYYCKDLYPPREEKVIQATFWSISVDQIKNVTHFVAKESPIWTKR